MAGPWEKYATAESGGPWEKYAGAEVQQKPSTPKQSPQEYVKQLTNDPKYRADMAQFIRSQGKRNLKQEAVRGLPMGNRLADAALGKYADPVHAERTVDETLGPQTESKTIAGAIYRGADKFLSNPAPQIEGAIAFPADIATQAYTAATSPEEGSLKRFAGETVKGIAAPLGLADLASGDMSFPETRNAWENNFLGSGMTVAGAKAGVRSLRDLGNTVVASPKITAGAGKLMDMTLKQPTTLKQSIRDTNVKTALEGEYQPNSRGVDRLNSSISSAEGKLRAGIESGKTAGVRGSINKAIQNLDDLRRDADLSSDPVANHALIDAEILKLQNSPLVDAHGTIDIGDMQGMKVNQGREIQKSYGEQKPQFANQIDKARVRGFKEEIEQALDTHFPELKETNKQLGEMYQLKKVLERATSRIENNQGIGIGLPIKSGAGAGLGAIFGPTGAAIGGAIGTLVGVIEHPSVAPRLATAIYKAQKGAVTKTAARKLANRRLADIKMGLLLSNSKKKDKTPEL